MPITEAESLAALPSYGFIRDYVDHAMKLTDSPVAYHLATGLATLATCIDPDLHIWFGGTKLYAPVWMLLVGRSGADRKTTAVAIGSDLLRDIDIDLIGDEPGSPEGLRDSLKSNPKQTIFYPEFGEFLQKSNNESSQFAAIRSMMTKLYDCHTVNVRLSSRRLTMENPRMSVLAACTSSHIEEYTGPVDYHGGFMSRFATIHARRERSFSNPPRPDEAERAGLLDRLIALRAQNAGLCQGFDRHANDILNKWQAQIVEHYASNAPEWTRGAVARAPTLARKVALLYAADFGKAMHGQPFEITLDELIPALSFAELHLKSIVEVTEKLTGSRYGKERKNILAVLHRDPAVPCSFSEFLRHTMPRIEKRRAMQILDSLVSEGIVFAYTQGGEPHYTLGQHLIPDAQVVAFDGTTLA